MTIKATMNRRHFFRAFFTGLSLPVWAQSSDSPWRTLFDGVENSTLVGSQDTPGNGGLLLTEEQFEDFEVVLEMNNDFGPDSGLFLRCTEDGKAYQCLIDYYEGGTIGGILGEGLWNRRGVRNYSFGPSPSVITLHVRCFQTRGKAFGELEHGMKSAHGSLVIHRQSSPG